MSALADYTSAHWQGKLSLTRSYLLGAVPGLFLLAVAMLLFAFTRHIVVALGVLLLFYAWVPWYVIGLLRCGIKTAINGQKGTPERLFGSIAVAVVAWLVLAILTVFLRVFRYPL